MQRSGYPDLRIIDLGSKRVFYLDPKLYATGSRDSSFRAFIRAKEGDEQSARRRGAFRRWIRALGTSEKWRMEIHTLGPCRSFAVQRESESRIPGKQPRHVPAGNNCGLKREMTWDHARGDTCVRELSIGSISTSKSCPERRRA